MGGCAMGLILGVHSSRIIVGPRHTVLNKRNRGKKLCRIARLPELPENFPGSRAVRRGPINRGAVSRASVCRFRSLYFPTRSESMAAGEPSPRSLRRTWSSNSAGSAHGAVAAPLPKCVCAPATHAGSFKCRLHRVNSHGHSAPSSPSPRQPAVSTSATRTVEAS